MSEPFELPRRPGSSSALTFAWATPDGSRCGMARLGLSPGDDGMAGSALLIDFAAGAPRVLVAQGGIPLAEDTGLEALEISGVRATVEDPLRRWRLTGPEVELVLEAAGDAVGIEPAVGGLSGFEQLATVTGTVGGAELRGYGQRGFGFGAADWRKLAAVRTVSAWFDGGRGVALTTARPGKAKGHGDEEAWAVVWDPAGVQAVEDPRISTTFDGDGRQRRCGLELWVAEDDDLVYPRRASGTVLCGTTLELGALTYDCAFFRWTMEGHAGIGRYDRLSAG